MTDTETGLLREVLFRPADDTVRLAYADYLDETADAAGARALRAEFIRVQVELARLNAEVIGRLFVKDGPVPDPVVVRHAELGRRQDALLTDPRAFRGGEPPPVWRSDYGARLSWKFARGWIAELTAEYPVLFGGPCPFCPTAAGGRTGCQRCSGSGEFDGCAAAVFATEPVVRVNLRGFRPARAVRDGRTLWSWSTGDDFSARRAHEIPPAIALDRAFSGMPLVFDTPYEALAELSRRCVNLGRSRAAGWVYDGPCPACDGKGFEVGRRDWAAGRGRPGRPRPCQSCKGTKTAPRGGLPPLKPEEFL